MRVPRTEACIASVVRKKKESLPFGCQHSSSNVVPHPVIQIPNCEKKRSHLQLCVKRPTPSHTTLIQTQHQKPELCPSKNLSPPSFGDSVHHDPNIELWMPVPSLVCLQRSGQDGRWTDPGVNPWQPSCFMALLMALPNVYDPRRWSFRKNATSLMSWSRLSDPSCNWTSAHFGMTWNGIEKEKNFDQKKVK